MKFIFAVLSFCLAQSALAMPPPPPPDTRIGQLDSKITFTLTTYGCDENKVCSEKKTVCAFDQKVDAYDAKEGKEELLRLSGIVMRVPDTTNDVSCNSLYTSKYSHGVTLGLVAAVDGSNQTITFYENPTYWSSPQVDKPGDNDLVAAMSPLGSHTFSIAQGSATIESDFRSNFFGESGGKLDPNVKSVSELSNLDNSQLRNVNIKIDVSLQVLPVQN